MATATRMERDSMGEMPVPRDVLFGASTQRAAMNFPVSGQPVPQTVIKAYAVLKKAAAESNHALGKLSQRRMKLIARACDSIESGLQDPDTREAMMRNFPIDIYQTGSGTSTNMNLNEVISNMACQWAGQKIGAKKPVHPNDHVNMGQSSNDTFPTAMQVAGAVEATQNLLPALKRLRRGLAAKSRSMQSVMKIGRTHLMDATPMTLGQEFSGYAAQIKYGVTRAERAINRLSENLPIGGTAIGTGINTSPQFAKKVVARLSKATGVRFTEASNHFEAQATRDCIVEAHGELKTIAISLSKVANDIRLLGSGPRCGLYEILLPAVQPGSSIMPGKVNPVICEAVMQVACRVVGNDATITIGAAGGIGSLFELNLAMPVIAASLLETIELLTGASTILHDKCVVGIKANKKIAEGMVEQSLMLGTALAPVIGYDAASRIAKAALASGRTIRQEVLAEGLLDEAQLDRLLDVSAMIHPH